MKPLPTALRQALWITLAVAVTAALSLSALRVVRSMRRGRGAAFTLAESAPPSPLKKGFDALARWTEARGAGLSADEAWDALALCPGAKPLRAGANDRRVVITLNEDGRATARRALHLASGGQMEFTFPVPDGAVLTFHTGARGQTAGVFDMAAELLSPGRPGETVDARKASFFVDIPKGGAVLAAAPPSPSGLEIPWRSVRVDLSPWAGQTVTLRLRTSFQPALHVSSTAIAHAFWAAPTLWVPDPRPVSLMRGAAAARGQQNAVWVVFESFPVPAAQAVGNDDFPGLAFLTHEGVAFQQVYTNRTDAPGGLRRLLMGRLQERAQGPRPPKPHEAHPLPAVLRDAGYQTVLIGAPAGSLAEWSALGFDDVRAAPSGGSGGESTLREAARWLAANGGKSPHFLMVFVRAPSAQEDPSPRCWLRAARLSPLSLFRAGRWRGLAQAVQIDGALERLWAQIIRLGQDGNALLSVSSLRGPSTRAEPLRRQTDHRLFRAPLNEPGWGLREEEVRVLWLMRHTRLGFERRITAPAQLLDAAPTVLELLGLVPDPGMEGLSFIGKNARDQRADQGARFLIEGAGGDALVLDGHYKYIRRAPAKDVILSGQVARTDFEPEELYDLWADPGERRNLALRRRDLLARARRAITEHLPERTAVSLVFEGYADPPLRAVARCPGGDLWNVALSTGDLVRSGSNEVSVTVGVPRASFSFETWPPPASYSLVLRAKAGVPADAFLVSRLGLPLVEAEKRTEWFDDNKFPWMDGLPQVPPRADGRPRVLMGRVPVRREAP